MNKQTSRILFSGFFCLGLFLASYAFAVHPPTANAGPDLFANHSQTLILQGSGYDPNNYTLSYYWNCNGGSLSSYSIAQPTFSAPSTSGQTSYNCSLTVTNSTGLSAFDSMTVNINSSPSLGGVSIQTNSATNIYSNQATLNGSYGIPYLTNNANAVWFQYGTSSSYGSETPRQSVSGASGSFNASVTGLSANTTYYYRAVFQNNNGAVYGSNATFNTSNAGNETGFLSISKKVINLTSGNYHWQASVNANPSDTISFAIAIQAGSKELHNVVVRDILPANLIYTGNLLVNASLNYAGDLTGGINIGTIPAQGVAIISYQARLASAESFSYGLTTLNSTATITSSETGSQTVTSSVLVNKWSIYGAATYIPTGLTNDFLKDSFLLPLFLIALGSWAYFSGNIYKFSDWLGKRI